MKVQYSENIDRVIYGKDISGIETVNDWIGLIEACLDQSGIDDETIEEMEEILADLRVELKERLK